MSTTLTQLQLHVIGTWR